MKYLSFDTLAPISSYLTAREPMDALDCPTMCEESIESMALREPARWSVRFPLGRFLR